MKWKEWDYFNRQWKYEPKLEDLRQQRAAATITRSEYKAGIGLVKQDLLRRMLQEGRITEEDLINPGPPKPEKAETVQRKEGFHQQSLARPWPNAQTEDSI